MLHADAVRSGSRSVVERAVAVGTPRHLVESALDVTRRNLGPSWTPRSEAYFWGVLKRRALRGEAPSVTSRLVVDSFVRELRDAGHTAEHAYAEAVRVFGASVESCVLDAYRPRPERAA